MASFLSELEVLSALYGEDNVVSWREGGVLRVQVSNLEPVAWLDYVQTLSEAVPSNLRCEFHLPEGGRAAAVTIHAPWLSPNLHQTLTARANQVAQQDGALAAIDCVVNECNVSALITSYKQKHPPQPLAPKHTPPPTEAGGDRLMRIDANTKSKSFRYQIDIHHGSELVDRKSIFQPHLAIVHNKNEVMDVLKTLSTNNRYARATHNMVCYRLKTKNGFDQDHDSDGESGAGTKMQWLMDTLGVEDVVVVVSRWYGGIQLGPDRFKHINSLTRAILQQHDLLPKR